MRLGDARAEFRARRSLEAIDFGAHLARASAWPIARAVGLYSLLPTLLLVGALSLAELPWLAALAVFWLRPIDARIALLVSSRALFGAAPSLAETGRLLWSEGRRRLLWDLTLGRLVPTRAATLPVDLLEGIPRARRAARYALVSRGISAPGLALACFAFELVLVAAGFALVEQAARIDSLVGRETLEGAFFGDSGGASDPATLLPILYALAAPLGETLHALGGFALYLNRRTLIEGWDIELAFRRLAKRAGAAALALALVSPGGALAAPVGEPVPEYEQTRATVEEVLERPEFGEEVVRSRYVPRLGRAEESADVPSLGSARFAELVAELFAWAAISVLAAAALFALVRLLPALRRPSSLDRAPGRSRPAAIRHGPRPRERSPRTVLARARALAREGRTREALALLYGGAVAALTRRFSLSLTGDATEGECLRAVRESAPDDAVGRFSRLTSAWELAAYGDRLPEPAELEALIDDASPLFEGAP